MTRRGWMVGMAGVLALAACQARDPEVSLIGRWRIINQSDGGGTNWDVTFSGTGVFTGEAVQWTTVQGRPNVTHRVQGRWTATQSGETVALRMTVQDAPADLQANPAFGLRRESADRLVSDGYVMERQPQP